MKLKQFNNSLRKQAVLLFWCWILTLVVMFGGLCNFKVIQENGGRMPVLADFHYESDKHFTYQNKEEVNSSYLSDIYPIGDSYYSIGDLIMFVACSTMISLVIVFSFRDWKRR